MASPQPPHVHHGICKCCRTTTYLKNMWEPQEHNGQWEVYGQMLVDCFGIDWTIISVEDDNICQVCISKLRVSTTFKKQIVESQATSLQEVDAVAAIEEVESTHRVQVETIPTLDGKEVAVNFIRTTPTKPNPKTPSANQNLIKSPVHANKTSLEKENINNIILKKENLIKIPLKKEIVTPLAKEKVATLKKENLISVKKENVTAAKKENVANLKKENVASLKKESVSTLKIESVTALKTEKTSPLKNDMISMNEENSDNVKKEMFLKREHSLCLKKDVNKSLSKQVKSPKKKLAENSFLDKKNIDLTCYEGSTGNESIEFVNIGDKGFEDVEFLEEDVLDCILDEPNDDDEEFEPKPKKARKTKGIPRGKRKMYKNYTEEDVRRAVEAVRSHEMSRSEASRVFKVPRETIGLKAQLKVQGVVAKEDVFMKQLVKAIRAILTYTNATPFKVTTTGNNYKCFFCTTKGRLFQRAEDLRKHTRTSHQDKIKHVEFALRPRYLNQMARVDIHDLECTECLENVSWEELLDHLQKTHGITDISDAWTCIVPYDLEPDLSQKYALLDEMACVIESCNFLGTFCKVDTHMNGHFPNYLCGQCGKSYVTEYRLKCHMQLHHIGPYPCDDCSEVFSSLMKRKLHRNKAHGRKINFCCMICPQRFDSLKEKMNHLKAEHDDQVAEKGKSCNFCGKSFWGSDFTRHMKFEHNKHVCHKCGRRFDRATRLKTHICKPSSPVKNFKCSKCMRLFFTKEAVLVHIEQKHKDVEK